MLLIAFVVGSLCGAVGVVLVGRVVGARVITSSRQKGEQLLRDADADAVTRKKQAELDTRNEVAKRREEFERETNTRRDELEETNRTLAKREDSLDRKLDALTAKEKFLDDLDMDMDF